MATYNRVSPANLSNFSVVIDDPTDLEDSDKLAQVDLQTRRFVYDFLASKFDGAASDVLKPAAVADTTVAGKVKGSTGNAGIQQGIVQGTVSTPDLRDGAVTGAKITNGEITAAKIATGAVGTTQLADAPSGVTTGKISDLAITTAKLAAAAVTDAKLESHASDDTHRAVGTNHIKDDAVTTAKIADGAVGPDAMATGSSGQILVADGSGKFQKVAMSGAATISSAGVLTLATVGYASVREVAGNTVAGGGASAATWNVRGVTITWTKDWETLAMVTIGASGKISLAAGTYIIEASCPAYEVDAHIARISRYNSSDVLQESVYGSSEQNAAAADVTSRSVILAKLTFVSSDYFKIEHWTETAKATDGLGFPSSSGGASEVYTTIKIHKIA